MRTPEPVLPAGWHLVRHETIGSTNDEARNLAQQGAAEGTLVWALAQTHGRGRHGRHWVSPAGNLYLSLVLRPDCRPGQAAQLGFAASLALADAIAALSASALRISCKWPNDVLANGRKLAGILLESTTSGQDAVAFLIVGLGVNLAVAPSEVDNRATSLAAEGIAGVTPDALLAGFAREFSGWLSRWRADGFAPVRAAWLARASGLGDPVRVRLSDAILFGRFGDIDAEGALLLDSAGGRRRITAGEIFPAA